MSQKPITLLFLCDTAEAEQRWRNFLTYFPAHGYACSLYALKTGQMVTVSAPDEPLSPPRRQAQGTLAGLLSAHNGQSALVPIADATSASALLARHHAHSSPTVFLAPNSRHLARLLLSSHPPLLHGLLSPRANATGHSSCACANPKQSPVTFFRASSMILSRRKAGSGWPTRCVYGWSKPPERRHKGCGKSP